MRLRPGRRIEELREAVDDLRRQVGNFSAWTAGPSLDAFRNVYLSWVRDAEGVARRFFVDVPPDQFATARWSAVISDAVPGERLWSVIEGDANAQLDWFATVIVDTQVAVPGQSEDEEVSDLWKVGRVRLFVSHLASKKKFVATVADELSRIGIQGFVAHEAIAPSREWQVEIERALRTADAFVGLLHPGFAASTWTQQELGWALSRRLPVLMVRLGEDPTGFAGRLQAPSPDPTNAWSVASAIAIWLSNDPGLGPTVTDRLLSEVRTAASYEDAERAALRVEQMGRLSPALLDELARAYRQNDQLYPNHIGARVIRRIFAAHDQVLASEWD